MRVRFQVPVQILLQHVKLPGIEDLAVEGHQEVIVLTGEVGTPKWPAESDLIEGDTVIPAWDLNHQLHLT